MKRKIIFKLLFGFGLVLSSVAQQIDPNQNAIDSLNKKLKQDSIHTYRPLRWRPYASYDKRNSFLRDLPVNYRGVQLGFIFKESHTMGIGGYEINQKANREIYATDNQNNDVSINIYLKYLTLFYQYRLINQRFFEIDIPIELGAGTSHVRVEKAIDGDFIENLNKPIFPIGGGLQLILKPVRWIGVSFMGGYRYVGETYKNLNFNGTYYSIGVWVDIRQIYRDIKFYGYQKREYRTQIAKYKN